jgi:hypothetical protein
MKTLKVIVGYSGKKVGTVFEANDKLASFLLKTGHVEIVQDAPAIIAKKPEVLTREMPHNDIVRRGRGRPPLSINRNTQNIGTN